MQLPLWVTEGLASQLSHRYSQTKLISGVGEGGQGGGTLGHDCTLKFNEEKISSCSISATVAIPSQYRRPIYIYETTVKQIFASDCTKSCLRTLNFLGGIPLDPPRGTNKT